MYPMRLLVWGAAACLVGAVVSSPATSQGAASRVLQPRDQPDSLASERTGERMGQDEEEVVGGSLVHGAPVAHSVNLGGGAKPKAVSNVVAVMLISSLAFMCTLFYLVNNPDEDIRRYSWTIISTTICIFCAVMLFNSGNGLTTWVTGRYDDGVGGQYKDPHKYTDHAKDQAKDHADDHADDHAEDTHHMSMVSDGMLAPRVLSLLAPGGSGYSSGDFWVALVQAFVWALLLQLALVLATRSRDHGSEGGDAKEQLEQKGAKEEAKGQLGEHSDKGQHATHAVTDMHVRSACVSQLMGHIAGFAAIAAFGHLMQLPPFKDTPSSASSAVLIALVTLATWTFVVDMARARWVSRDHSSAHLLAHDAAHGEDEVIALCISWLLVQQIRYAISGVLPDTHGGEPDAQLGAHTAGDIGWLFGVAALFEVIALPLLYVQPSSGTERTLGLVQTIASMANCWAIFFAVTWLIAGSSLNDTLEVYEDSVMIKVIVACIVTVYAICIIFILDKVADSRKTTDTRASSAAGMKQLATLIGGYGLLIGFSWEQAFERSVSTICQTQSHVAPEAILKLVLGCAVVAIVLPAWRLYIVPTTIYAH